MRRFASGSGPLAIVVGVSLVIAAFEGRLPYDLLHAYALAILAVVAVGPLLVPSIAPALTPGLRAAITAFVAFELVLHRTTVDRTGPVNRVEHFGALALLTLLVLAIARVQRGRAPAAIGRVAIGALVFGLGVVNEVIEWVGGNHVFLSPDTRLDLLTNTLAITLVLVLDGLRSRSNPRVLRAP